MSLTFPSWLLHQIDRTDEVGALAREFALDGTELTHEYLDDEDADDAHHGALIRAQAEWTLGQHYPADDHVPSIPKREATYCAGRLPSGGPCREFHRAGSIYCARHTDEERRLRDVRLAIPHLEAKRSRLTRHIERETAVLTALLADLDALDTTITRLNKDIA